MCVLTFKLWFCALFDEHSHDVQSSQTTRNYQWSQLVLARSELAIDLGSVIQQNTDNFLSEMINRATDSVSTAGDEDVTE